MSSSTSTAGALCPSANAGWGNVPCAQHRAATGDSSPKEGLARVGEHSISRKAPPWFGLGQADKIQRQKEEKKNKAAVKFGCFEVGICTFQ